MGFSQEMKDFLGAWQGVSKMNSDADYKDALSTASRNADKRAQGTYDDEMSDETDKRNEEDRKIKNDAARSVIGLHNAQAERYRERDLGSGVVPIESLYPGAAAIGPPQINSDGTLVRAGQARYAQGGEVPGAIPDEGGDEEDGALPMSAQYTAGTLPAGSPAPRPTLAPRATMDAFAAIPAGYGYLNRAHGLGAVRSPRSMAAARAMQQGAGGLSPQEMDAARKAIDPDGAMPEGQRNLAALGAVYRFWMNKNEPEKAAKVSGQMLQHYRAASENYAAIAAHAAEQGNMTAAAQGLAKAYANIPDGKDVQIVNNPDGTLKYNFTGEDGNTVSRGIMSPSEVIEASAGMAKGGFDKIILKGLAEREAANPARRGGAAPREPKPEKLMAGSDAIGVLNDTVAAHEKAQLEAGQKKDPKYVTNPDYWNNVKNVSAHILQQNTEATPDEVVSAAKTLMTPDRKDNEQYRTTTDEATGMNTIHFKNGVKMNVNDNQLDVIVNRKTALRQQMQDEEDQAKADAAKPGLSKRLAKVGKAIGDAAADQQTDPGVYSAQAVPSPTTQRSNDSLRMLNSWGAIPDTATQ